MHTRMYNRPSCYYGFVPVNESFNNAIAKFETTKNSVTSTNSKDDQKTMRYLVDFYSSIPDYTDIKHLPAKEFHSTLTTLKIASQDLKRKSIYFAGKPDINKSSSFFANNNEVLSVQKKSTKRTKINNVCRKFMSPCKLRYNDEINSEIANYEKTRKYLEPQLQNGSPPLINGNRHLKSETVEIDEKNRKIIANYAVEKTSTTGLSNHQKQSNVLRKSHSLSNIKELRDEKNDVGDNNKKYTIKNRPSEVEKPLIYRTGSVNKLCKYFNEGINQKIKESRFRSDIDLQNSGPSPETKADDNFFFENINSDKKDCNEQQKSGQILEKNNNSVTSLDLYRAHGKKKSDNFILSPRHPVARLNLAATLRAEFSKRKLLEMQNDCICRDDTIPQSDWEVRRTPAWKSLAFKSIYESHDQIVSLRLATRKHEQAIQRRNFKQTMELMRQRVKSIPLLLEGTTDGRTSRGKAIHNCNKEGLKHSCMQLKQNAQQSVKTSKDNCENKIKMIKEKAKHTIEKPMRPTEGDDDHLTSTDRAFL